MSEWAILGKNELPDRYEERNKASRRGAEDFVEIKPTLMGGLDG